MSGPEPNQRSRWRPRLRFSLRAFLLLVAVFCAWLGYHVHLAHRQQAAVAAFRDFGGWVKYDYQFVDGNFDGQQESWVPAPLLELAGVDCFHAVVEINLVYDNVNNARLDNDNVTAAPLEHLAGVPKLTGLYLHGTQATDENLAHLRHATRLEKFFAWDAAALTDEGTAHLARLRSLTYIHINDGKLTDQSLKRFAELPNLEGLSLQFNRFSDDGVQELSKLEHLESLWVCGKLERPNDISDESLEFLLELANLKSLGVQNTEVSTEFIDRITAKFPGCSVAN